MKTLIFSLLALLLSACSHIPSLGPGTVTKTWHVHPDDTERFQADFQRCRQFAVGSRYGEQLLDSCLQQAGYRLEIVKQ